ncbi:MAG: phosphoglucomutase/phosphomannomutase family protein [Clostridia bacterium]|nr:phosphoglucomutase/phosphomannomutase family protein [Clostridia bacterium]
MTPIHFGTGGWRATIGDDFIKENIYRVAQGIANMMTAQGKNDTPIVIGHDRRFLSDTAAKWVAEVLCANGFTVHFIDRSAPTPLVMFLVKDQKLRFGIEITASHNPASDNGIKLIVEEGRDAPLECTNELEKYIAAVTPDDIRSLPFADAKAEGLAISMHAPFDTFIDSILSRLDLPAIRQRDLRILFDPMHGSGNYPLTVILNTARCTLDTINYNKDAYFGGENPAPTRRTLEDLSIMVCHGGYDLGIAFDGDGDRLGIIDNAGNYMDANSILVMLYYYLHEYRGWHGPVVRNLATTHMLDRVAESFGEICYEVPVGFKYISAKIDEADAVLGGESSGGLTVRGHIHGKDSIYAASLFVEMVCATGKTPAEFWAELVEKYGHYSMQEDNLRFRPENKAKINRIIMEDKQLPAFEKAISRVSYEDGCKIYFADDSFLICRFSGTEALLRIFAEAADAETARRLIATMRTFLGEYLL